MTRAYNTATTQQNSGGAVAGVTAGKNAVINGAFDVWQRGTSGTSRGYNSADRWFCNNPGVGGRTFSRQASDLAGFQYFMRMQRTAANTLTDGFSITYNAETADSMRFAGQTVTLSWWMRKGANYSGGAVRGALYSGTGTDQNADNAYTGAVAVVNLTGTPTTSWVRYSVTGTVSSSATELAIAFVWDPTGTAGAADYLDVTGFQLEVGSVDTPFSRAGGTLQGELAACQRYYQRVTANASYGTVAPIAWQAGTTDSYAHIPFPVVMRTNPSSIDSANIAFLTFGRSTAFALTSVTLDTTSNTSYGIVKGTISGGTNGTGGTWTGNNNSAGYLAFNAEL